LDNLARSYNQQSTVHAGYLLTALISLVALYNPLNDIVKLVVSLLLSSLQPYTSLISIVIILGLCVFFTYGLPLFKYLLGRIQLYTCLSEIVWDHMGNSGNQEYFQKLKRRTRMFGGEKMYGIQDAILSYFEASLYVSRCREKNGTKDGEPIDTGNNWKVLWHVNEFDIESQTFFAGRGVFRLFKMTDLLQTAYSFKIRGYKKGSKEQQMIAGLLDCPPAQKLTDSHEQVT
jgi:hypothetical protein